MRIFTSTQITPTMRKNAKILGWLTLSLIVLASIFTGISIFFIKQNMIGTWDQLFGWGAALMYVTSIPLLIIFIIAWINFLVRKK
jgi:hypothetical protein